jgi:hypothetical protein
VAATVPVIACETLGPEVNHMATRHPASVTIGTQPFVCTVCRSGMFWRQSVHLTSNTQLFGWAKPDATGLLCAVCGYLHLFYNDNLQVSEQ